MLGLGYKSHENVADSKERYSNLPQLMVDQGLIQSQTYSLWPDGLESSTGTILFGGVDTEKFLGTLQTLPIERTNQLINELEITLSGLSISNSWRSQSLSRDLPAAVLFDSGSGITYPNHLTDDIYTVFNVEWDQRMRFAIMDCLPPHSYQSVVFAFTSVKFSVPPVRVGFPCQFSG